MSLHAFLQEILHARINLKQLIFDKLSITLNLFTNWILAKNDNKLSTKEKKNKICTTFSHRHVKMCKLSRLFWRFY